MAYNSDEIRGVMIQVGDDRLLLPNATVAEVLAKVPVEPVEDAPDWLPGRIDWHGWQVPLVKAQRWQVLPQSKSAKKPMMAC